MKTKHCYVVHFRAKTYRVVLGHLDEFVALMQPLEDDIVIVSSLVWQKMKELEWYVRI